MPMGNGRGPNGMGPLTGRGLGNCRSLNIAGAIFITFRRLFGWYGRRNFRR